MEVKSTPANTSRGRGAGGHVECRSRVGNGMDSPDYNRDLDSRPLKRGRVLSG